MNYSLIVYVEPFILRQQVAVVADDKIIETYPCMTDDLKDSVLNQCYTIGAKRIHLFGLDPFVSQLREEMLISYNNKFGFNEIEIEVN